MIFNENNRIMGINFKYVHYIFGLKNIKQCKPLSCLNTDHFMVSCRYNGNYYITNLPVNEYFIVLIIFSYAIVLK